MEYIRFSCASSYISNQLHNDLASDLIRSLILFDHHTIFLKKKFLYNNTSMGMYHKSANCIGLSQKNKKIKPLARAKKCCVTG